MDYALLKRRLLKVRGIGEEETAESLIKSIVGHLVSRVGESTARRITAKLPEPLTFEKLRGHQIGVTTISKEQYIDDLVDQFGLDREAIEEANSIILHEVKSEFAPDEVESWEKEMPEDWVQMVESV